MMKKDMKIGFVGISSSGMPKRFANCIKENFKNLSLISAWDEDGDKCKEFCELFNIRNQSDSPESVAKQSEVIIMDTKSCDTATVAPAILQQGTALYLSKPLANNLENGLKVLNAARSAGTPFLCTSTMRYEEATQETSRKIISSGVSQKFCPRFWQ